MNKDTITKRKKFNNSNLLSTFLNIYLIITGTCWILFHLFFRLILKKSSYELSEIKLLANYQDLIIFTGFVVLHFFLIMSIILYIYRKKYNKKFSKILADISKKLSKILDIIYWKPLEILYEKIGPNIPSSGRFFLYLEKVWSTKKYSSKYFYILEFLFDVLPKIIIAIIFVIEILIYKRIHYFLYSIILIFIPRCFRIFLNLLIDFGVKNLPIVKNYFLEIKGVNPRINLKGEIVGYDRYEWILKQEYEDVVDPQEEMLLLLQLESVQSYGLKMKDDLNKILPYINLITSLMYFIAGFYRLFIILN